MPYELCRHIKANGLRCHSPALTDEMWCFFHSRLHFRHRAVRAAKAELAVNSLHLPPIEDNESVQVATSLIVGALGTGHLDEKRATAILRALQLASKMLASYAITTPRPESTVRSYMPTLDGLELAPREMSDRSTPPRIIRGKTDEGSSLPLNEDLHS